MIPDADAAVPTCPNCGEPAARAFCASCGQRQGPLQTTVRQWFREFTQEQFDLDARLPRTLRTLITQPGALVTEWKQGRRASFISPVRLYLLASLAMFSAMVVSGWLIRRFVDPTAGLTSTALDAIDRAETNEAFGRAVFRVAPQVLFLMVPVFALLVRALHRRARSLYLEDLLFALSCHSFAFLILGVGWLFEPEFLEPVGSAIQVALMIWVAVYLVFALRRVYGGSWLAASTKGLLLLVSHFLLAIIVLITTAAVWLRGRPDRPEDRLRAADVLYTKAFSGSERGDTTAERQTRLQAIAAYRRLANFQYTPHVRYHLARLLMVNREPAAALVIAREGLVAEPDHLLLLGVGMNAAHAIANDSLAAELGERILVVYQKETTRKRSEYAGEHAIELGMFRVEAQRARK